MLPFIATCFPLVFFMPAAVKRFNKKVVYAASLFGLAVLFPFLGAVGFLNDSSLQVTLTLLLVGQTGLLPVLERMPQLTSAWR